jgi:hypothetical protein
VPATAELAGCRRRLAARQAALLSALVTSAPVPPGLDADRVAVQAEALIAKRRRTAQRAWPELAAALGNAFVPAFEDYARATPRRTADRWNRTRSDAVGFAAHLRRAGLLPRGFRMALLRAQLRARLQRR